jgi:hypothetical protein
MLSGISAQLHPSASHALPSCRVWARKSERSTGLDLPQPLSQAMLRSHTCSRLRVVLHAIFGSQRHCGLDVVRVGFQKVVQFDEELLEPSRGDDLQETCRLISRVPEGVQTSRGL